MQIWKRDGKEERRKDATMTRCCLCISWYHDVCTDGKRTEQSLIWNCPTCRLMPGTVEKLMVSGTSLTANVERLSNMVKQLQNENRELSQQLSLASATSSNRKMLLLATTFSERNLPLQR
jgi:hypothetical protein